MLMIDVPQLAYKTWNISVVDKNTGKTMFESEKRLKNDLQCYEYNKENEHVR